MGDEMLSNLALLCIEKDSALDVDIVKAIEVFADKQGRRPPKIKI
jgi:hypothetical protein